MRARRALLALALVATVTACSSPAPDATSVTPTAVQSAAPSTSPAVERPGPLDVVSSVDLVGGGGELRADIYPLVRLDGHIVLTMDVTATSTPAGSGDDDLFIGDVFQAEVVDGPVEGGAIRLVDLGAREVYLPGIDAEGDAVGAGDRLTSVGPDTLRVQRVYGASATPVEELGLLLPGGFVPSVPLIDDQIPSPSPDAVASDDDEPVQTDVGWVVTAPVLPLETFSAELDGAVSVVESTTSVEVNLGGDVLFDSDSAELRPDSEAALNAAVRRMENHAPGTVEVVGHTDDVGDDQHNQTLSEQRAEAVATALEAQTDTTAYPLVTAGRGESEPLVPNTSDNNRQLNRRVTLTLVSESTATPAIETEGDLPPFDDGPTATGAEGVVMDGVRTWHYRVPEARRVGDSLVIDLHVTAEDDEVNSLVPGNLAGVWSYRGPDASVPMYMLGLTVLSGTSVVYPYDYKLREDDGGEVWNPLGSLDTQRRVDGGQTIVFTAIYPGFEDADTVAVQLNHNLGATPFRLTDIPVTEATE